MSMSIKKTCGWSVSLAVVCAIAAGAGTARGEDKPAEKADAKPDETVADGADKATPAKPEAKPAAAEKKRAWETTAMAGATYTSGNSDTVLFNAGVETKRKWDENNLTLGINGGYGKSSGVKNAEFVNSYGQYNHLFSERFYAGLRLEGAYDGIADLDYRARVSPLAGYYLIKNAKTTLSVESGPSVIFEKYKHMDEDTYLGARFGERFEYKLSPTTKVWQSVEYVPRVDRWAEKFLVTAEAGIETAITKSWSLRVVLEEIFDSSPANDKKKNDVRLIAGTSFKF